MLWLEGYWVRTSYKVNLTKEDKKRIGRPSSPRWELDVIAFNGKTRTLKVVECKSFFDSSGVKFCSLDRGNGANRYKLFNDATLREVVLERLRSEMERYCGSRLNIRLCLACGKVASERDRENLRSHFERNGWELFDKAWMQEKLLEMSNGGYENQAWAIVSKILLRDMPATSINQEMM